MINNNRFRKSIRLKYYDYSQNGAYFVTICVHNHMKLLGELVEEEIVLNKYGKIIEKQWEWLFNQYSYLIKDEYCIMPNHFHAILFIERRDEAHKNIHTDKIKPLPQLIGAFKTTSSKLIHVEGGKEFLWQKSFYERIIRNENELFKIRNYIVQNSLKLSLEKETPDNLILS